MKNNESDSTQNIVGREISILRKQHNLIQAVLASSAGIEKRFVEN